jgi:hypothetical protein
MTRLRLLVRDYERPAETLTGLPFVASVTMLAHRFFTLVVRNAYGALVSFVVLLLM